MTTNPDLFEDRLKIVIDRVGTVAETARKVGVAEATVRKWRDGETDPQRKNIVELAKAGNVNIAWLAANDGPMEKHQVQEETASYGVQNRDNYLRALQLCEEVLQSRNVDLKPDKKVELVKIVAGMIEKEEESEVKSNIYQLVQLAS